MRNEELQAIHDEIWRQIYDRQRRARQLGVENMPPNSVQDNNNSNNSQHSSTPDATSRMT